MRTKARSSFWRFLLISLSSVLLFFDPDIVLSSGYVGGLRSNYLDLRLRLEGILVALGILGAYIKSYKSPNIPGWVYLVIIFSAILRSNLPLGWGIYKFLNVIFIYLAPLVLMSEAVRLRRLEKRRVVKILFILGSVGVIASLLQVLGGSKYLDSLLHAIFIKLGEPPMFEAKLVCCSFYFPRAYGFLPHPNVLAFVALVFLSLILYLEDGFTFRATPFILLVILSLSKVGIVVLFIILSSYLIKPRFTLGQFKVLLIMSLVFIVFAPLLVYLGGAWGLDKYYFFITRNLAFKYFISILDWKKLIFGVGFLNYFIDLIKHTKLVVYNGTLFIEPIHNSLWLYTIEFGIVGFLFFIYFYYTFFCNKYKKMKDSYARNLVLTILITYTMFMAFDHFLYY